MRIRYSRWDGTQEPLGPEISAGDLLEEMSGELLSGHGLDRAMSRLMRQGMHGRFNGLDALRNRLRRFKDMLAELNRMIEARDAGEPYDFDGFMQRFGDFFPDDPKSLDELLEQMARRMAAMSRLLSSMSAEQRAELEALSRQVLED